MPGSLDRLVRRRPEPRPRKELQQDSPDLPPGEPTANCHDPTVSGAVVRAWYTTGSDRSVRTGRRDVRELKPSPATCMYRLCPPGAQQMNPSVERPDHRPCALRLTLGTTVPRTVRVDQMVRHKLFLIPSCPNPRHEQARLDLALPGCAKSEI